jgi:hypothetical protein
MASMRKGWSARTRSTGETSRDGWTVNLEKKPTDAQLLKSVIQKLLGI